MSSRLNGTLVYSFLLNLKNHFYNSHKLHHPQPSANESTLPNAPTAGSIYLLMLLVYHHTTYSLHYK